jgi:hypothetical protein
MLEFISNNAEIYKSSAGNYGAGILHKRTKKTEGLFFPRLFLTLCGSRTAIFLEGVIYLYLSAHSSWRQHQRGCVSRWGDVDASGRSH